MRSISTTTPPRRSGVFSRGETTPKLTPSSSSGSSTSSSPLRGDSPSGYTGSTLTTRFTAPHAATASPSRRRTREDASILRGAALVRKNLILPTTCTSKEQTKTTISGNFPMSPAVAGTTATTAAANMQKPRQIEESEDEWSDPWTQQEVFNQENGEEFSMSYKGSVFSSQPSIDEQIHWASMALVPRNDDDLGHKKVVMPQQKQMRCVSPLNWAEFSDSEIPPPPQHAPPPRRPASPTPSSDGDGTHITSMGRGRNLRLKIHTYHVQRSDELGDDTTYEGSCFDNLPEKETFQIIPQDQNDSPVAQPKVLPNLPSPLTKQFDRLQRDPAYLHAQNAGYLWQSLAGQHVRFPPHWFGPDLRGPPMGTDAPWQYIARHAVHKNPVFNRLVSSRSAAGRLLVHLIVRDLMTGMAVFDLAIGIFHPNARGIRATSRPEPKEEQSRHVWMAIRKMAGGVSLMDAMLCRGQRLDQVAKESPFGKDRRSVTNLNMRAVFGGEPPVHTICIQESELYERLSSAAESDLQSAKAPALLILQEFLVLKK